jgi:hypothetical protein
VARVHDSFAGELRHERIQKAKFKSVEQMMEYEGFEEMVRGAHLQPMNLSANPLSGITEAHTARQREGTLIAAYGAETGSLEAMLIAGASSAGAVAGSCHSSSIVAGAAAVIAGAAASPTASPAAPPSGAATTAAATPTDSSAAPAAPAPAEKVSLSAAEFEQEWARHPAPATRAALLLSLSPTSCADALAVTLGFDKLADVVAALAASLAAPALGPTGASERFTAARGCFSVLHVATAAPRFGLATAFMSAGGRAELRALFDGLQSALAEAPAADVAAANAAAAAAARTAAGASAEASETSSRKRVAGGKKKTSVRAADAAASYPMMLPGWGDGDWGALAADGDVGGTADAAGDGDAKRLQPDQAILGRPVVAETPAAGKTKSKRAKAGPPPLSGTSLAALRITYALDDDE